MGEPAKNVKELKEERWGEQQKEILEQEDSFKVDDEKKANWVLRQIRHLEKKKAEKEEMAEEQIADIEEEIAEIEQWLKKEKEQLDNKIEHFKSYLKEYAYNKKEEEEDFKTLKLPFGKIQFRKQRDSYNYKEEELLDSVKVNKLFKEDPDIIKVKERVQKRNLKGLIKEGRLEVTDDGRVVDTETGNVLDGIQVTLGQEELKIKVD